MNLPCATGWGTNISIPMHSNGILIIGRGINSPSGGSWGCYQLTSETRGTVSPYMFLNFRPIKPTYSIDAGCWELLGLSSGWSRNSTESRLEQEMGPEQTQVETKEADPIEIPALDPPMQRRLNLGVLTLGGLVNFFNLLEDHAKKFFPHLWKLSTHWPIQEHFFSSNKQLRHENYGTIQCHDKLHQKEAASAILSS